MLSADELFVEGKLRPLVRGLVMGQERWRGEQGLAMEEDADETETRRSGSNFKENPRCASMVIENSRRQTTRSCVSLNNSRCSSPTRATGAAAPKSSVPAPSSKHSIRFMDFFKLKKKIGNKEIPSKVPSMGKEAPSKVPSMSKENQSICKEVPLSRESSSSSSSSSSCKSPRSFWPFSRSNSAGENKSAPSISPSPRRSNSAGESKTSSSSLLPSGRNVQTPQIQVASPNSDLRKFSANHPQSTPFSPLPSSSKPLSRASPRPPNNASKKSPNKSSPKAPTIAPNTAPDRNCSSLDVCDTIASKLNRPSWDFDVDSNPNHQTLPDPASNSSNTVRVKVCQSPGRPLRRVPGNPARNFARGSPGRRGVWNSPGRVNGGRGAIRMDGGAKVPKILVRPQGNRENWKGSDRPIPYNTSTMRISPVLNVPVYIGPSLRGSRASSSLSKSKIFGLGKFFSKKERAYAVLPPTDSQSGA